MKTSICGLTLWGPRKLPKQASFCGRCVGISEFMVEFMKSQCVWRKKKKQPPENNKEVKQEILPKKTSHLLTLEEWILASPSRNISSNCRVYPIFEKIDKELPKKLENSFCLEEHLMKEVDKVHRKMEDSSSRSSHNGKTKKRVRFKLPEVADIFIFDSPGGYSAMSMGFR